jgi:hypothetical protein
MSDRSIVKAKRRRQALLVVVGVLAGLLQHLGVAAASPIEDSISEEDVAPGNLIQNGDFTSNSSGWQSILGSWLRSDEGFAGDLFAFTAGGGSLTDVLISGNAFNQYGLVSQCTHLAAPASTNGLYFETWAAVEGWSNSGGPAGIDAEAILQTFTSPDCTGPVASEQRAALSGSPGNTPKKWSLINTNFAYPAGRNSVRVYLSVVGRFPFTHAAVRFDKVYMALIENFTDPSTYPCLPDGEVLCLSAGRFIASAMWKTADGKIGFAGAVQEQSDSGYLYFFNKANIELVVKVLNACSYNSRFWVFAAGLTDVEVTLKVTDTKTGATRTYKNPLGKPFAPIQDTAAFATCP